MKEALPDPERNARLLALSALNDLTDARRPPYLYPGLGGKGAGVAAVFWDNAVDTLEQDWSGGTLVALVENLDRSAERLRAEVVTLSTKEAALAELLDAVIDHEAAYGGGEEVGDHLTMLTFDTEALADEGAVRWEHYRGNGSEVGYRLVFVSSNGGESRGPEEIVVVLAPGTSWAKACRSVRGAFDDIESRHLTLRVRALALAYRRATAEQVAEEYEVLGHVARFAERDTEGLRLVPELEAYIEAALVTVLEVERGAVGVERNYSSVQDAVCFRVSESLGEKYERTRANAAAASLGLWSKRANAGRPSKGESEDGYTEYRDALIDLARRVGTLPADSEAEE